MNPIFLLAGAPAVGKSTTARALAAHFPKSLHIPVDDLREMVVNGIQRPGADWNKALVEQLNLARSIAVQMALTYRQAGFTVAIDDFWDPDSRLAEYDALFQELHSYRIMLFPSRQAAEARNLNRSGSVEAGQYIAEGIRLVYENLQSQLPSLSSQGWQIVDTSGLSVEESVAQILRSTRTDSGLA
jgi:chloramphenicol 3-O-phosphotransferase